jgi:hypothetical protein
MMDRFEGGEAVAGFALPPSPGSRRTGLRDLRASADHPAALLFSAFSAFPALSNLKH